MNRIRSTPHIPSRPQHGMATPHGWRAPDASTHSRGPLRLAVLAALVVAGPAYCQTGTPAGATTGGSCAGVMEQLDAVRASTPARYTKTLMAADNKCLGMMERLDKAGMITRDEYVKAYHRQPDCSAPAYSYMCE